MRRLLIGSAVLVFALAAWLTPVNALPDLLTDARAEYPNIGGTRLDDCALCHDGGGSDLNSYGAAFDGAGQSFSAIEGQDSDGDGASNIVEINALTFPGDASDTPGGGGRILGRGTLEPSVAPFALAAAADVDRDEAFIVWGEGAVTRDGAKAAGGLVGWLVDDEGSPIKKAANFASGGVNEAHGVGAAYATKKKRFVVTWTSPDDAAMAQVLKSKVNKLFKKPVEVAADSTGPVPDWDADLGRFLIASGTSAGVAIDELDTKGKVKRRAVGRFSSDVVGEFAAALGFASGALDSGRLLLATADVAKGDEPGLALVEKGAATTVDTGVDKASKKGVGMAAAINDEASGIVVIRGGTKVKTGELDSAGALSGKAAKLKGAKAGAIGVAPQQDGTFLVVWVDAKKGTLLAVDRSADGKTTSKSFELHADGEDVVSGMLAVTPLGGAVLVVYVTDGEPGEVRTVVVGPGD